MNIRHKWVDAVLVVIAVAALAGLVGEFSTPAEGGPKPLKVDGDGLRPAQWHDLPARPIQWQAPATDVLRLEFPGQLTLGRMFTLTVHRSKAGSARLQLLAENDQLIAETAGAGKDLTVQWLPPVVETLVLKARLLDGAGKVIAQGPVPLAVRDNAPLQVQGRFSAPSFDTRVLNELLANSNAVLDWQVTLGKTVTRTETAREAMATPGLMVVDAAYVERLPGAARAALLDRVAGGMPLIVLASNAADPAMWARTLQLNLKASPDKPVGAPLAMSPAPLNPVAGVWAPAGDLAWTRQWQEGRIVWLGAVDWHRYAISEPRSLGLWWQRVLDAAGVSRPEAVSWIEPEEMPLAGQRLEICALGVRGDAWQRRPDKADASCMAVWPKQAGWMKVDPQHAVYVYEKNDWPMWQMAQRRDATARYAARTPAPQAAGSTPLPAWPFALLFTMAMLALWWRERR
ncbi:hypothetical protein [Massilia polaris]|nr:hypothetical protein [Massilia polaris]